MVLDVRVKGEKGSRKVPCSVSPDLSEKRRFFCLGTSSKSRIFPYPDDKSGEVKEKLEPRKEEGKVIDFTHHPLWTYQDPKTQG